MSKTKKNKDFEWIYSKYCVHCMFEGTYKCKMEVCEGKCENFTLAPSPNFGGY